MTRRLSTPRPADHPTRRRGGFSMIELLIVITVIAILAGLLLGGVQSAMGRVRVASVVSEIKNLEKAIRDFNSEFGVDPPSFIILCEQAADWGSADPDIRASRAFIRQLWKDFDFTVDRNINGINGVEAEPIRLNGAECLVFFLGGLMDVSDPTNPIPKGFSKVSAAPFGSLAGAAGSRSGPFYEFESKQLRDLDGDGMYEYLDSIPGQQRPIQYFSSYGGTGYRPLGRNNTYDGATSTSDDEVLPNTIRWVYTKSAGAPSPSLKAAEPFNPNGFQLISPGLNGEFCGELASGGTFEGGGFMDPENGVKIGPTVVSTLPGPAGTTITRDAQSAVLERDNITNFSGGEIH